MSVFAALRGGFLLYLYATLLIWDYLQMGRQQNSQRGLMGIRFHVLRIGISAQVMISLTNNHCKKACSYLATSWIHVSSVLTFDSACHQWREESEQITFFTVPSHKSQQMEPSIPPYRGQFCNIKQATHFQVFSNEVLPV